MHVRLELATMIENYKNNASIEQYDKDYYEIIQFVDSIREDAGILELNMICRLAYSWMPTILREISPARWHHQPTDEVFWKLRNVNGFEGALEFVDVMGKVAPVNKSWVGTSKVLHFVNPEWFPIWDSRVARVFSIKSSHKVNQKSTYVDYLTFIAKCPAQLKDQAQHAVNKVIIGACSNLNPVCKTRAIEKVLFFEGRRQKA
ncbi:MAG: hypothetical protein RIE06_24850 [Roseibium album]|uniref:hypothetical protein n=1 Tax=Roseibium album TaxID=311410 RepID=UPI00131A4D30|nr:hypothetical protein [Labrenzia sp. EL_142]MBG6157241.1 hypothetical protein [Labrenzia sp. EL_162]MBG6196365.1 hypothetical protein [Labrenzia sp. EL_159]